MWPTTWCTTVCPRSGWPSMGRSRSSSQTSAWWTSWRLCRRWTGRTTTWRGSWGSGNECSSLAWCRSSSWTSTWVRGSSYKCGPRGTAWTWTTPWCVTRGGGSTWPSPWGGRLTTSSSFIKINQNESIYWNTHKSDGNSHIQIFFLMFMVKCITYIFHIFVNFL